MGTAFKGVSSVTDRWKNYSSSLIHHKVVVSWSCWPKDQSFWEKCPLWCTTPLLCSGFCYIVMLNKYLFIPDCGVFYTALHDHIVYVVTSLSYYHHRHLSHSLYVYVALYVCMYGRPSNSMKSIYLCHPYCFVYKDQTPSPPLQSTWCWWRVRRWL